MEEYRILAINPKTSSTKIGVYNGEFPLFESEISHDEETVASYKTIAEQYQYRKTAILETLDIEGMNLSKLDAAVGRGGLLRPIEGGTYAVNESMLADLKSGYAGQHPSNLGGILAYEIANGLNIPAYIVDPVVVDELDPIARISGIPFIERKSIFHALNHKAVARWAARRFGKNYHETNLIVAHLGGGISVGAHRNGRVIDVNNGLHGDGPFSPERAGTVPAGDLISLCFSGHDSWEDMMNKIVGEGGLLGYLGTNNIGEVEEMIAEGNDEAKLVFSAMAYQIAKEIGAVSVVLYGKVDAIVLTGRLTDSQRLIDEIIEHVHWIADVIVHPGENELLALAQGAYRVLTGEEMCKSYPE